MGTGTGVETSGRTQDGDGDGSGDGNDSSNGDGNGDGNEDGIGEGGGGAKKRKKPHKNCRRYQALSFRTRHHLCRQGVALAGTWQLRLQGPVPVHADHTQGGHQIRGAGRSKRGRDRSPGRERGRER